ncbi:MAG: hypothetical protein D6698_06425 [Gammaproteobacteria bacterium]|nr:MAG: hypothetical protein D6698_06425 [Gammaproteobacteria bacterium]
MPAVKPVSTEQNTRPIREPIESRSFESLLEEAKTEMPAMNEIPELNLDTNTHSESDPDVERSKKTPSSLDGLQAIENASIRKLIEQR